MKKRENEMIVVYGGYIGADRPFKCNDSECNGVEPLPPAGVEFTDDDEEDNEITHYDQSGVEGLYPIEVYLKNNL